MSGRFPGRRQERLAALGFLLPNLIGFLCFTAGPVLASLLLSFSAWDLIQPPRWVGLENYTALLGFHATATGWAANDPDYWKYLGNTFFLMLSLPLNMALSLSLALVLNQNLRFRQVYRMIFFLPSVLSGVAIFYLWRWMYNPEFGLFNNLLHHIGIEGPHWLTDPLWAKPSVMIMVTWLTIGGTNMILYLAALQGVPSDLYEAADIDGAGRWQKFRVVTWPAVLPVTFFILTMGIIGGLQTGFEMAYVMTNGGPFGATTTLGYYIYQRAYVLFDMGYASAIAYTLFVIVLGITLLNWRLGGRDIS